MISYTKNNQNQSVVVSLANNTCGAELTTISGNAVIDWGTQGTAIPQADLPDGCTGGTVGTVDIAFSVQQTGYLPNTYTVTVTRTYLETM